LQIGKTIRPAVRRVAYSMHYNISAQSILYYYKKYIFQESQSTQKQSTQKRRSINCAAMQSVEYCF
jgi:hypothetical protein